MNAYLITAALGYLLGSIPFGYLLVRVFHGDDVRCSGSGNIGAAKVARRLPALGVATILLDAGKGVAAVWLAKSLYAPPKRNLLLTVAASFAVLGHMFPLWLKFRGGKGVATSLGAFALVAPKSILCIAGVFLVLVPVFRYVSLGSVVAAAPFPLSPWGLLAPLFPPQLLFLRSSFLL